MTQARGSAAIRITGMRAENIKRIEVAEVAFPPAGGVLQFRGKNRSGKSSAIDAIEMLIGGAKTMPPETLRRGASEGIITATFDPDGVVVTRRVTSEGSTLEVRAKDGAKYGSPQKLLDAWMGPLKFAPGAFLSMKPADQAEALKAAVGLDFTELDRERARLYEERTGVNASGKAQKARLDAMPPPSTEARVDVTEVLARQEGLLAEQEKRSRAYHDAADVEHHNKVAADALARQRASCDSAAADVKRLERSLAEARGRLAEQQEQIELAAKASTRAAEDAAQAKAAADAMPDMAEALAQVAKEIAGAGEVNRRVDAAAERTKLEAEVARLLKESATLSQKIGEIDAKKTEALAVAKFPVPGVGFAPDGVTLNGLPLVQASQAERITLAFGLWLATHPRLRVVPIPDASLLDEEAIALIAKLAAEHDAQVILEIVGDGDVGVVFSEGRVAKVDGKPTQEGGGK